MLFKEWQYFIVQPVGSSDRCFRGVQFSEGHLRQQLIYIDKMYRVTGPLHGRLWIHYPVPQLDLIDQLCVLNFFISMNHEGYLLRFK